MTDAVVLAAGRGSRLAGVTERPKWLVPVRDRAPTCPAEAQLAALAALEVDRLHVVVCADTRPIEEALARWAPGQAVELVENDEPISRNNWYSVLLGLGRALAAGAEDVVLLNSDLYAGPGWFVDVLRRCLAAPGPAALVVDTARGRTDEAMKVSASDDRGTVRRIGKVGVDDPVGEYVGAARWTAPSAAELCAVLSSFVDAGDRADHWYEHGIDDHLAAGARYSLVETPDSTWVEIDDVNDLRAAGALEL